jgi:membrane-bound metal-dependent hydrolase YbcI (DUF457 family)
MWGSIAVSAACFIPSLAFTLIYGFRSQWRVNYVGWGIMNLSTTLTVVLGWVTSAYIWPHEPFRNELRYVLLAFVAAALWAQLLTLVIAQREPTEFARRSTDVRRRHAK